MWIQLLGPKPPKGVVGGMVLISLGIVSFILWYFCDLPFQTCPEHHSRASNKRSTRVKPRDACLQAYGGLQMNYTLGETTTFRFDLCETINCSNQPLNWRGYDVYLCLNLAVAGQCGAGKALKWRQGLCDDWGQTAGYSGRWKPSYDAGYPKMQTKADKISLVRN
ncbi:hypothetical protein AMECASPLE_036766 [Ameca splendens]|uniref:Uncharacterized protein n=1 Tax=Ameca splendens TaxID=208324 RepID=A0ABV1A478_9TELE